MIKSAQENLVDLKQTEEKGNNHKIMTVQEVASYLRISRFSVYNLVKRGELPAMKILNKLRFDRETVDEFLEEQKLTI
jgi:putative molybdopterin biosynthesis protein